jgi:transketolase C-terminal domain/subunit
MSFIGAEDRFGESGTPAELVQAFGLEDISIKKAAEAVLNMKKS